MKCGRPFYLTCHTRTRTKYSHLPIFYRMSLAASSNSEYGYMTQIIVFSEVQSAFFAIKRSPTFLREINRIGMTNVNRKLRDLSATPHYSIGVVLKNCESLPPLPKTSNNTVTSTFIPQLSSTSHLSLKSPPAMTTPRDLSTSFRGISPISIFFCELSPFYRSYYPYRPLPLPITNTRRYLKFPPSNGIGTTWWRAERSYRS